jgi:hypothetical protein
MVQQINAALKVRWLKYVIVSSPFEVWLAGRLIDKPEIRHDSHVVAVPEVIDSRVSVRVPAADLLGFISGSIVTDNKPKIAERLTK